jgi:hypothetical protein
MVELVDTAMLKVRDFPYNGEVYFEILSKCYLNRFKYTETELLELLQLERSSYYDRKKEAIMGVRPCHVGWCHPAAENLLSSTQEELSDLPWEVIQDERNEEDAFVG